MTVAAVLKQKSGDTIISVPPGAAISDVAELISSRRIGAVLVLGVAGELLGIVSERDVVKALAAHGADVLQLTAADLMTRNVTTATPNTTVDEAMEIMDAGYFRHLPVMHNGNLLGILSIRDLVKYRMMLVEHDVDTLRGYISRTGQPI